ncbi:MAG: TIR domain-containing protein [Lachnospiraceae bacterium]|nr:TIR domain-containing protein [Lachnospiraceae bacterium]
MRYNAFISYRHSELDMFVAKQVHRRLETFRVPRKVQKATGIKNIKRVFRDQEELPIGSDLGDNISSALEQSEFLLVICSPRTPQSYWVQTEIKTFIGMHGRENVLAILIEGEPNESFPPDLLTDENGNPVEPLAADVRGKDTREVKKKLRTEIMRLAAPLLHCSYDDLRQRHRERQMRRAFAFMTAGLVLASGIAAGAIYTAKTVHDAAVKVEAAYEETQRAYEAEQESYRQQQIAYRGQLISQSKVLAQTAENLLKAGDRMRGIAVALAALPSEENDRPYEPRAEMALNEVLYAYNSGAELEPDRIVSMPLPVQDFKYNPNGDKIVVSDNSGEVAVFTTIDGQKLFSVPAPLDDRYDPVDLRDMLMTKDDITVIAYEHSVSAYDPEGQLLWTFPYTELTEAIHYSEAQDLIAIVAQRTVDLVTPDGHIAHSYKVPEEEPRGLIDSGSFSPDGSVFACGFFKSSFSLFSDVEDTDEMGHVAVVDTASGEGRICRVSGGYLAEMAFVDNERLAVAVAEEEGSGLLNGYGTVDCVNITSGHTLWSSPYQFNANSMMSSSLEIFCREIEDESGAKGNKVDITVGTDFYDYDAADGKLCFTFECSSPIVSHNAAPGNSILAMFERDGTIDYLDAEAGRTYPDNRDNTDLTSMKVIARKGCVAIQGYKSPDIVLLRYMEGEGKTEIGYYEDYLSNVEFSEDGTLILLDYGRNFEILDAQTYKTVYSGGDGEEHVNFVRLTPDDQILFFHGSFLERIDPATGESTQLDAEEYEFAQTIYYPEAERLVCFGSRETAVIDTKEMTFVYEQIPDLYEEYYTHTMAGLGGKDSEILCLMRSNNTLHILNLKDDSELVVDREELKTMAGYSHPEGMTVSRDGSKVAFFCLDGYARVLDTSDGKELAAIPFTVRREMFMMFSPDGSKLMLQGDDYYFRVFDLETGKLVYLSDSQFYIVEQAKFEEESGIIVLRSSAYLYVLDADSFGCILAVPYGEDMSLEAKQVLTVSRHTLYSFPYRTLEEQIALAHETLGDYELSEESRIQLNVD